MRLATPIRTIETPAQARRIPGRETGARNESDRDGGAVVADVPGVAGRHLHRRVRDGDLARRELHHREPPPRALVQAAHAGPDHPHRARLPDLRARVAALARRLGGGERVRRDRARPVRGVRDLHVPRARARVRGRRGRVRREDLPPAAAAPPARPVPRAPAARDAAQPRAAAQVQAGHAPVCARQAAHGLHRPHRRARGRVLRPDLPGVRAPRLQRLVHARALLALRRLPRDQVGHRAPLARRQVCRGQGHRVRDVYYQSLRRARGRG